MAYDDVRCTWEGCGLPIVFNEGGDRPIHECAFEDVGRWWPGSSPFSLVANKGAKVDGMSTSTHPAMPPPEVAEAKLEEGRRRWGIPTQLAEMRLQEALDAAEADETKGLPRGATARASG